MQRVIMRAGWTIVGLLAAGAMTVVGLNLWVVMATHDRIATSPLTCQSREVGIVFGTSHGLVGGGSNPHYQARLDTAAQLYRLRRVSNLLLSGDNRTRYYNEPMTMWRDLRARNVPQEFMTLDYAGFSTFDTLVRAHKVFGVDEAVLVTQPWHLPRALFIADALGLEAVGCPAISERQPPGLKLMLREWLARAATVGDLYLWGRKPRFLGPQESLPTPVLSSHSSSQPSASHSSDKHVMSPAEGSVTAGAGQQAAVSRDMADGVEVANGVDVTDEENAADTPDPHALARQAQASLLASLPRVKQALLQWLPVRSDTN
ncbi:ElyC/SanA/YdcF family protein [Cobetia sp. 29-18-1]|uniref:SanA/YdcF family protein n=1 Tax=Cobetia sp. 29-18-1 TaxID=3040018 RepID=UPI00244BFA3F|nr:ElyC/SanA/YdcF family protein [Cobetia sp. 29-18-1]MDH2298782.1 ElyC/SanA/YdcF family protein [Cobetia sp. 29-18-1]